MAKQDRDYVKQAIVLMVEQSRNPVKYDDLCKLVRENTHANSVSIRAQIDNLLKEGVLMKNENNRIVQNPKFEPKNGVIEVTSSGHIFCDIDGEDEDYYIHPSNLNGAIEGDKVKVVPIVSNRAVGKRVSAKVVEIVRQTKNTFVGRIKKDMGFAYISCTSAGSLIKDMIIGDSTVSAKAGDAVVAEIIKRPTANSMGVGRVIENLGQIKEGSIQDQTPDNIKTREKAKIREYEIFEEWPDDVRFEVSKLPSGVSDEELKDRHDYSFEKDDFGKDVQCFTIDGEDAKDFDDAVGIARTKEGGYRLYVHIADVAHYVTDGSALNQEALTRATSIYFPTGVLPMLPEELSNDLCSLNEKTKKLTMSCVIDYDKDGNVLRSKIEPSAITSARRCTYTEVYGVLTENEEYTEKLKPLVPAIKIMHELSQKLTAKTKDREALSIDSEENKYEVSASYESVKASKYNYTDANRLIENFMISANIEVAKFLLENKIPGVYRVHEEPDKEKYIKIKDYIKSLGYKLPDDMTNEPTYENINTLLEVEQKDEQTREIISNIVLRSLKKAVYKEDCLGHFGLALEEYCHFTSPIRRLADLFVHRELHDYFDFKLKRESDYNKAQEKAYEYAEQATIREQVATDCEREIDDFWMCVSLKDKIGQTFEAQVCGGNERGVYVKFDNINEGFVPFSEIQTQSLLGHEKGGRDAFYQPWYPYTIKDFIKIKIADIDLDETRVICENLSNPEKKWYEEPVKTSNPKSNPLKPSKYIANKNK